MNSYLNNVIYRQPAKDNSGQLWSEVPSAETRLGVPHAQLATNPANLRNSARRSAQQTAPRRPNSQSNLRVALLLRASTRDFAQISHELDRASFGAISCQTKQGELQQIK